MQIELIQGVGGVRAIPDDVVRYLAEEHGDARLPAARGRSADRACTAPARSSARKRLGITPDLLTLGKGASDMMFPVSATLYSAAVHAQLEKARPGFADGAATAARSTSSATRR